MLFDSGGTARQSTRRRVSSLFFSFPASYHSRELGGICDRLTYGQNTVKRVVLLDKGKDLVCLEVGRAVEEDLRKAALAVSSSPKVERTYGAGERRLALAENVEKR